MKARVTIIDDSGNIKGDYELNPSEIYESNISTSYIFKFVYNELNKYYIKGEALNDNLKLSDNY